jgi:heme/copper-type cytochrome/quinol oxidase subunit 2
MRRGQIETLLFVVVAAGAFGLTYYLARTVGLHPLVVPTADIREKHWQVAATAVAFVAVVDLVVFGLIALKHRRQRAAAPDLGPALMR